MYLFFGWNFNARCYTREQRAHERWEVLLGQICGLLDSEELAQRTRRLK